MKKLFARGVFILLAMTIAAGTKLAIGEVDGRELSLVVQSEQPVLTITEVGEQDDVGRVVKVLPDGTVVAAGSTNNGKDDDFALLQYSGIESGDMNQPLGISSRYYNISTIPVSNVTRNSAMTGGKIVSKSKEGESAIIKRGVCYSVTSMPVYRDAADETDSADTGSDADLTGDDNSSPLPDHRYQTAYNYDTVKYGCTSDGTGDGLYGSYITQITPGTPYYVRAYAVLSASTTESDSASITDSDYESTTTDPDGGVIYGNQLTFMTEDACFIATAAYGSILDKHVVVLRQFRDTYLKTSAMGDRLVNLYYHHSPGLAERIKDHPVLRFIARLLLIPLVLFSYFMLQTSLKVKLLLSVLLMSSTVFTLYYRLKKFNLLENKHVTK